MNVQIQRWGQGVGFYLFVSVFCVLAVLPSALFAGSILGWGDNYDTSDGHWTGQATPPAGNSFTAIAAGYDFALALKSDGSIVGWGDNIDWHGNWLGQATPPAGNNFIAIAAGHYFALALKSDGSIVAWGDNYFGECNVPEGNDFIAISAEWIHCLALKSNGSIVAWGDNEDGECNVPAGNNFKAIAAGWYHSLALKSDGSIVGWGYNAYGQATPPDGNNFTTIAAGAFHSLALKSDGSIVGWGFNGSGLGTPPDGNNFITIAAGDLYSLAMLQPAIYSVTKCTVTAGKTQGRDENDIKDITDSFSASGTADFPADRNDINLIKVTIADVCDGVVIYSQPIDFNDHNNVARKKGKYSYSHSIAKGKAGGITSLKIDFTKNPGAFSLTAKNIDLTGLGCPLTLGFTMGDHILSSQDVNEAIVNGPKTLIPTRLMRLYKDTLVASKAKVGKSAKPLGDSLSVSGDIAVADMNLDTNKPNLVNEDVNVVWGSSTFTIPAGSFKTSGPGHLYKCSKSHSAEDSNNLVTATIDLDQCTYSISVKKVNLADVDTSGTVTFGINFATPNGHFNKAVNVNLATGLSY
jgi:hypothetical protein